MEPTLQQKAELAAAEAQRAAAAAQAAALDELLGSITCLKDFSAKCQTKFEADKLKSAYIKKFGFDAFQTLCGRSR